jgi:thiol-disulfide isomerase/thioredoxin
MKRRGKSGKGKSGGAAGSGGMTAVWVAAVLVLLILCALTIYTAITAFFPGMGGRITNNNYYYSRPIARGPGGTIERFQDCEFKMMFFSMEQCPHCVAFKPEWQEFAKEAKKNMPKVCVSEHSSDDKLTKTYNVQGYPTVIFVDKSGKHEEYSGPRTSSGLKAFLKEHGAA